MKYQFTQQINVAISGDLSFTDTSDWNQMIDELLEVDCTHVTLDLRGLTRIDSSGIGLMMVLRDRAKSRDFELVVVKPTDKNVMSILQLANLGALFELVDGPTG